MNNLFCRVCGYEHTEPQWGEDDESPIYTFCACCGVEAGHEDYCLESIIKYRNNWLVLGAKWDKTFEKPAEWSLAEQMKNIPGKFI